MGVGSQTRRAQAGQSKVFVILFGLDRLACYASKLEERGRGGRVSVRGATAAVAAAVAIAAEKEEKKKKYGYVYLR